MFKGFSKAASDYSRASKLMRELRLWRFMFIPFLLAIPLALGIYWLSFSFVDDIESWLLNFWPFDWGKDAMLWIGYIIAGAIAILAGMILFKNLLIGISAPFMAPISEKIEVHLTGKKLEKQSAEEFVRLLVRGIRFAIRNIIMELLLTMGLLLLSLIPLLNLITGLLIFYLQAYYVGLGNMDYTLERHRDLKGTIAFGKKHKGTAAGNGIVFLLLLAIPVVGVAIALPLSCAAGTISTVEVLNEEN